MRRCASILLAGILTLGFAVPADAARPKPSKKSIWGPATFEGRSAFGMYKRMGVSIWQNGFSWAQVAPTRPVHPADPNDPAYQWPASIDEAVREAARHRIGVALMVMGTPAWANGGRSELWAPNDPRDYARFMRAASRRYPSVRHWMIWGEPSRNLLPMPPGSSKGPRVYSRMLDAACVALKRESRRNRVIGAMSWAAGTVRPADWPRMMRLPNGRRPRMDLWGHNPYEFRRPRLRNPLSTGGFRGLSDIAHFIREIDRDYGYRRGRLKLWLSEYCVQSEHDSSFFKFHVSRREQALYVRDAFRIVNRMPRIATLGWYKLDDDPYTGHEFNCGLIAADGERKPAFHAFRRIP